MKRKLFLMLVATLAIAACGKTNDSAGNNANVVLLTQIRETSGSDIIVREINGHGCTFAGTLGGPDDFVLFNRANCGGVGYSANFIWQLDRTVSYAPGVEFFVPDFGIDWKHVEAIQELQKPLATNTSTVTQRS